MRTRLLTHSEMDPRKYYGAPMDKKFNPKLTENSIRGLNFCCKTNKF